MRQRAQTVLRQRFTLLQAGELHIKLLTLLHKRVKQFPHLLRLRQLFRAHFLHAFTNLFLLRGKLIVHAAFSRGFMIGCDRRRGQSFQLFLNLGETPVDAVILTFRIFHRIGGESSRYGFLQRFGILRGKNVHIRPISVGLRNNHISLTGLARCLQRLKQIVAHVHNGHTIQDGLHDSADLLELSESENIQQHRRPRCVRVVDDIN